MVTMMSLKGEVQQQLLKCYTSHQINLLETESWVIEGQKWLAVGEELLTES